MADHVQLLRIELIRGGEVASLEVGDGSFLVGTGSHCDVRLLPDEGAVQHLRVECRAGQAWGQALSHTPQCELEGAPFSEGTLPHGSQLRIGEVALRFTAVSEALRGGKKDKRARGLPPVVQAAAFIALAVGFYVVLSEAPETDPLALIPEAPALFPAHQTACSAAPGDVDFEAHRCLREANLKRERAPFHARDGLEAVALYEQAEACFTRLGAHPSARAAARQAAQLRAALADEYHVRRIRLERLLHREKYVQAQHEVAILQDFLHRHHDGYSRWLSAVQRELTTRFARAENTK